MAFKDGYISILCIIPCPLRPRFNRIFEEYLEEYNRSASLPIYCPSLEGMSCDDAEELLEGARTREDLPELIVATAGHGTFSHNFRSRFVETGLYEPCVPEGFHTSLPVSLKGEMDRHKIGLLAASGWSCLLDQSVDSESPLPGSWLDLADPCYAGEICLHGCDETVSNTALLYRILKARGEAGLEQFARNVTGVKHFSRIIKAMDSSSPERSRFSIMPGAAATQIPRHKRVAMLDFAEGPLFAPLQVLAARETRGCREEPLAFFYGEDFRKLLTLGGYIMADEISPDHSFVLPDYDHILSRGYEDETEELKRRFSGYLVS
ncbi:extracellular solute-binding protein [Alkalispirochaeta americana]|uniref:Extracellular solute-binding protein n=1 Tax=Alkalispirochaeta americana TaxID=159291 RepID=A0A1N6PVG4_9SPIO|nr:ABC transporter substrate-binding protein [Alkalispirochaeta americana]SIQ08282.1 extracellular solute-binding protein [Alkalispirochaeta americana]